MHLLQTASGRVPLPDSLLNFHAKMSQYEMQHFQGELLRDKSEMGLIFLLSAQMTTTGRNMQPRQRSNLCVDSFVCCLVEMVWDRLHL